MGYYSGTNGNDQIYPLYVSSGVVRYPYLSKPGDGVDLLYGNGGDDYLNGGGGNDWLFGGDGNDTLDGGTGSDKMDGGDGDDRYFVSHPGDTASETGTGIDTVYTQATHTLSANIENLTMIGRGNAVGFGNDLDNVMIGNGYGNFLWGWKGVDTISGGAGNDTLSGGDQTDFLYGNAGDDLLFGDNGDDWLYGDEGNDRLNGGAGNDRLNGGSGADTMDGGNGNDRIEGSYGNDEIFGMDGNDRIFGGYGDDDLEGGDGDDRLFGQDGDDILSGGKGDDRLRGDEGADQLSGGWGDDVFVFTSTRESNPGARDIIQYNHSGTFDGAGGGRPDASNSTYEDLIHLAAIDADTTAPGNQAFTWGGTGKGQLSVVEDSRNTIVRGNTDDDAEFEFELMINDGGALNAADYNQFDFIL